MKIDIILRTTFVTLFDRLVTVFVTCWDGFGSGLEEIGGFK
jgi:hypothetical protein